LILAMTQQPNLFGWIDDDPEVTYTGDTKRCSGCRKVLPINRFGYNKAKSLGRACTCKKCLKVHSTKMRELHAKYQVPENHSCPICEKSAEQLYSPGMGNKTPFRLDHDHVTGAFRGFICDSCNTGMGKFRDNPDLMQGAIDYLRA
jgi:hypothetical protein